MRLKHASYPGRHLLKERLCELLRSYVALPTWWYTHAQLSNPPKRCKQKVNACILYAHYKPGAPKSVYVWRYCFQPCKVEAQKLLSVDSVGSLYWSYQPTRWACISYCVCGNSILIIYQIPCIKLYFPFYSIPRPFSTRVEPSQWTVLAALVVWSRGSEAFSMDSGGGSSCMELRVRSILSIACSTSNDSLQGKILKHIYMSRL